MLLREQIVWSGVCQVWVVLAISSCYRASSPGWSSCPFSGARPHSSPSCVMCLPICPSAAASDAGLVMLTPPVGPPDTYTQHPPARHTPSHTRWARQPRHATTHSLAAPIMQCASVGREASICRPTQSTTLNRTGTSTAPARAARSGRHASHHTPAWPRRHHHIHTPTSTSPAAAAFGMNVAAEPQQQQQHAGRQHRWRVLGQCLLLGAAATCAAPGLLLLDIGEQATLGMQGLQQAAALSRQHKHHKHQQRRSSAFTPARPLLPLWPPVLPMVLAVAPVGLLLLSLLSLLFPTTACRHLTYVAVPALLLGASIALQGFVNLGLVVAARVKGTTSTSPAAAAHWAGDNSSSTSDSAPAGVGGLTKQQDDRGRGSEAAAAAVRLYVWTQVGGDLFRAACACSIAWLAAQAMVAATSGASGSSSGAVLVHSLQQCVRSADAGQLVAAASVASAALQSVVAVCWPHICILGVCAGSAAVHCCSIISRCHV